MTTSDIWSPTPPEREYANLQRLVAGAAALRSSQVCERTRHQAARVLADTVGAITAGARTPELST